MSVDLLPSKKLRFMHAFEVREESWRGNWELTLVQKSHNFEQKWMFMPGTKNKQVCVYTDQKPRASLKTWLSEPTWVRMQHTWGWGLWSH